MGEVYFCLLWHHHQPCYREGPEGRYAMPWVRLHGIKDYYGMAWLAQQHPDVHLTFNLVPSLLSQLQDYADGAADEEALRLTAKPAAELDPPEARRILDEFFHANRDTTIRPHARYHELLLKRRFGRRTAAQVAGDFAPQDLLDLQVWATLAWFFPQLLQDDPVLRELVAKGHGFTEDDKAAMLARQREVLAAIVPMYRELQDRGTAELTMSPFYHPILPLLCKMERAREALPHVPLPREAADLCDDARAQMRRAVEAHRAVFGRPPRGMWPSEGSVSPEVPALAAEAGLRWLATDERILARSLGQAIHRDPGGAPREWETLYQPYRAPAPHTDVAVVFRDQYLSDLIGFHYYHRPPEAAAADFAGRLQAIAARAGGKHAFVAVVLDGENAWEYYRGSGMPFLQALYRRLASTPGVHPVTVSEYLDGHPPRATLPRLFSGSWINCDFGVWIGHEEDRQAWDALARTRQFLASRSDGQPSTPALAKAWEELYVAEGSDWFWWYGDDRSSAHDTQFDHLFRTHLKNVYELLGEAAPDELDEPISRPARAPCTQPTAFISPTLDGRGTHFFEWSDAGVYERDRDNGVAQSGASERIRAVRFGFDERELFLRVDFSEPATEALGASARLAFVFTEPRDVVLDLADLGAPQPRVRVGAAASQGGRAAVAEVLEAACPFLELGFRPRQAARFHVRLYEGDALAERAPRVGNIAFEVPTPDFEREMWSA